MRSVSVITTVISGMAIGRTRITAQGQVSVPSSVRRKLGIGPGSVLEWNEEEDGRIVVQRVGNFSSEDIHRALFRKAPEPKSLEQLKAGIRDHLRKRYARG